VEEMRMGIRLIQDRIAPIAPAPVIDLEVEIREEEEELVVPGSPLGSGDTRVEPEVEFHPAQYLVARAGLVPDHWEIGDHVILVPDDEAEDILDEEEEDERPDDDVISSGRSHGTLSDSDDEEGEELEYTEGEGSSEEDRPYVDASESPEL
jgi:hypothetical protein